jgi:hypothetical protein
MGNGNLGYSWLAVFRGMGVLIARYLSLKLKLASRPARRSRLVADELVAGGSLLDGCLVLVCR